MPTKDSSLHRRLKKVHSRSKAGTVMYQRLRNGTLDVNLETGEAVEAREEFHKTESNRLLTSWRDFVKELPSGIDVDHVDTDPENNRANNLRLKTERANRNGQTQTPEEIAAVEAYYAEIDF